MFAAPFVMIFFDSDACRQHGHPLGNCYGVGAESDADAEVGAGWRVMTSVTTYATTTPTMISGSTLGPACDVSSVASTTAESGSRSTATIATPIPTGTAADREKPGRCEHMIPAAAPGTAPGSRPPAVAPERQAIRQSLEHDQPRQRGQRPGPGLTDESRELVRPENRTSSTPLP